MTPLGDDMSNDSIANAWHDAWDRVHPRPWWFKLALRLMPARCREIPEATDFSGTIIVLRQVALWLRHIYLQQFASSEDWSWAHSHQWRWTLAIGLWGSYTENRLAGPPRRRRAPYCYLMDSSIIHQVVTPSPGHTSIFIGLWRNDDLKHYYPMPAVGKRPWETHVKKQVARI